MNKTELLVLGLPEENIREFQKLYHRDLIKAARRMAEAKEPDDLRKAIISTLSTIKSADSLRAILANVTHQYLKDYRENNEKAATNAANIDNGEEEQKSDELQCSVSSLADEKEEGQA